MVEKNSSTRAKGISNLFKKRNSLNFAGDQVPEYALRSILLRSYARFKLFYGGLENILHLHSVCYLKQSLNEFYTSFLAQIDFSSLDLLSAIKGMKHPLSLSWLLGVSYSHLQKSTYLSILEFSHKLLNIVNLRNVKVCLLWKHFLVWGNHASVAEIQVLVDYLTDPQTGKNWDKYINQVKQKNEAYILDHSNEFSLACYTLETCIAHARIKECTEAIK